MTAAFDDNDRQKLLSALACIKRRLHACLEHLAQLKSFAPSQVGETFTGSPPTRCPICRAHLGYNFCPYCGSHLGHPHSCSGPHMSTYFGTRTGYSDTELWGVSHTVSRGRSSTRGEGTAEGTGSTGS